jgi:hypothetical protein
MRRILSRRPINEGERNPRNMRSRTTRRRTMRCTTISVTGAAMLIALQLGWAVTAQAQANRALGNAGVTGVLATNTNWSIAKNGGFASGTVSWTVGVTKVSVSDQVIQVDGQFICIT